MPILNGLPFPNHNSDSGDLYIDFIRNQLRFPVALFDFQVDVRTPIPSHIDLAGNTSYHFAASRTVSHGCRLTMARDRLRLLAHVYDSVASIHMTENPGRHG